MLQQLVFCTARHSSFAQISLRMIMLGVIFIKSRIESDIYIARSDRCRRVYNWYKRTCFSSDYIDCCDLPLKRRSVDFLIKASSKVFDGTFEIAWNDWWITNKIIFFVNLFLVIFTYRRPPICVSCALII